MKLNFWQWLGVICLIGGAIGYIYFRDAEVKPARPAPAHSGTVPATAPTTAPTTGATTAPAP